MTKQEKQTASLEQIEVIEQSSNAGKTRAVAETEALNNGYKWTLGARYLVLLVAFAAPVVVLIQVTWRSAFGESDLRMRIAVIEEEALVLDSQLRNLHMKFAEAMTEIYAVPDTTITESQTAAQLAALRVDIDKVSQDIEMIEGAITPDPLASLSIPMLRRSIEVLEDDLRDQGIQLNEQLDRAYDQNKWIIGTLGLGLLALFVSTFITRKPQS